jgi:phage terminase large subunit-like protein
MIHTPTLSKLPPSQQEAVLRMTAASMTAKAAAIVPWAAYDHQKPPEGDWDVWALVAGRGAGKTEAGAHYVDDHAKGPACLPGKVPHRIAVVAPSHDDAVDTCVRGDSGLIRVNPFLRFHPGAALQADLTWSNGAEAELFGAFNPEDVERFRGPQHCLVWGDEFAAWRKLDDVWDMIAFGLRLGPKPRAILTTTPKRRQKLKEILSDPATAISRATTDDNPALPEARRRALYARYGGTVLGRQELLAELIDDVPGALWTRSMIAYREAPKDMRRIVVAVDPATTFGEDSDETGIIVDGLGSDGFGYTLADLTCKLPPTSNGWAGVAVRAYHDYGADCIVAESNQGGEMVRTVISTVDPNVPVRLVHASKGKVTRAEPVSSLYIPNPNRPIRWFHAEPFPELEDQMCSYTGEAGDASPDRMDAHVWGVTNLVLNSPWGGSVSGIA